MKRCWIFFVIGIVSALPLSGQKFCPSEKSTQILIENITVIDGTGGEPLLNRTVALDEGRIVGIYPADQTPEFSPELRIDGSGKFLMPGLIDMHTHLLDLSVVGLFVPYGVTTVRDVGTHYDEIQSLLRKVESTGLTVPNIFYCGGWIDGFPPSWPDSHVLVSPEQAAPLVDELVQAGASVLKIYNNLTLDPLYPLVEQARLYNIHVTADILFSVEIDAFEANDAGVLGLEHASGIVQWVYRDWIEEHDSQNEYFFGLGTLETWPDYSETVLDDLLNQLIANGVYLTPTFIIERQIAMLPNPPYDEEAASYLSPKAKQYWYKPGYYTMSPLMVNLLDFSQQVTSRFYELGGRVITGADVPFPFVVPGTSMHQELELFVQSGFSPLQAIHAATGASAQILGRGDLGTIVEGNVADLIVLTKDPLEDILNTREIEWVIRAGMAYTPEELLNQLSIISHDTQMLQTDKTAGHFCTFDHLLR